MSTAPLLKNLLGSLLLPPANGLLLLGLAALRRRRRGAFGLALAGALLLLAQSLPPVSQALIGTLERQAGPVMSDPHGAGAIVILGGGLDLDAPEYGSDTGNERTLVRLRYGAMLARRYRLPVLVTGGTPERASRSEADVMAEILQREFDIRVRWQENAAEDTADNARFSAGMLRAAGIRRVVLVTQAFHMPRARRLFEQAGLEVVPAPTGFRSGPFRGFGLYDGIPQASALRNSQYALHEWLGMAWIALRP